MVFLNVRIYLKCLVLDLIPLGNNSHVLVYLTHTSKIALYN